MLLSILWMLAALPQRAAAFVEGAPQGTGLEWMPYMSVLVPAVLIIGLVWAGSKQTV